MNLSNEWALLFWHAQSRRILNECLGVHVRFCLPVFCSFVLMNQQLNNLQMLKREPNQRARPCFRVISTAENELVAKLCDTVCLGSTVPRSVGAHSRYSCQLMVTC